MSMQTANPDIAVEDSAIEVRSIGLGDLGAALAKGWKDFRAAPTHIFFLFLIYPIAVPLTVLAAANRELFPLVFPVVAGLTIFGPVAAVILYEVSRQREAGQEVRWWNGFAVVKSSSFVPIVMLGAVLVALFFAWIMFALLIYRETVGPLAPASLAELLTVVFTTPEGARLLLIGNLVGFVFAVAAFAMSVVSFPLLVDRAVSPLVAVFTSLRVALRSPFTCLIWAATIVVLLALGCATALIGLAVVLPLLGHASWHLYRRAVA